MKSTSNKLCLPTTCVQLLINFHRVYLLIFCSPGQTDSGSRLSLEAILGIIFSVVITIISEILFVFCYHKWRKRWRNRVEVAPAPQPQVNQAFTITYHCQEGEISIFHLCLPALHQIATFLKPWFCSESFECEVNRNGTFKFIPKISHFFFFCYFGLIKVPPILKILSLLYCDLHFILWFETRSLQVFRLYFCCSLNQDLKNQCRYKNWTVLRWFLPNFKEKENCTAA